MFVVTLNKTSLKKVGAGALCCALVIFSAFLGRYISTRTVAAAAGVNRIESAQDIQTWFTGYGLDVDGTSITADKVKIPRKWDDSFSAFNGVVQQSGMDLTRYKGKTVEKWTALIPAASSGETSRYGVLLVYRKKAVGAYLLEKPSGTVIGLKDAQTAMAQAEQQDDVEPVGDFEQRELGAGIVGQHAAHDFLMPVVTGGDVEGRLGELDGQRVAERDEQERQVRQQRHVERVDVGDHEAAGGGGHAHEGEDDQRLVGEHLEQFALRAHVAVGRVGGKRAGHLNTAPTVMTKNSSSMSPCMKNMSRAMAEAMRQT